MASYNRNEARAWAMLNLKGVANVLHPSFSQNLKQLNEKGIRHDLSLCIEHGFSGTLLISEVNISLDEYRQFFEWCNDESRGRIQLIHHASWNTFEDNIEAVRIAEANGAELALLSYPPNFYPKSTQDIYDYTKAYCDATSLGVMLFPLPFWGFDRLHPSDIETALIRRLIDDCPNIVAIKAEGAMPSIMSTVECHRLFGKEVVVNNPLENEMIPLAQVMPMQFAGTSNYEYYGPLVPQIFKLLQAGEFDEATRLYWQLHPARKAHQAQSTHIPQTLFIHRMLWKFEGWLNGYNGGPSRNPTMRLNDNAMNALRTGLTKSGVPITSDPNEAFFVGRHPD
ncbi:dihydrodipicolinate synthase family protein [Pseudomonas syringae group genomosp. 3]|uniref:dihydrodipicolinate synthase family protein n=1 Tax=Pseudomonas syringae group genomosp. 3 TaxID=251701 RepID=UPI000EFB3DCD|nr:dihydrodipicolinate synthase family protein [Pseudomonas syringae group genomosp. 3]